MGLFGWLFSRRDFCQHDFQPLFSRFVDTVVDTFVAEDPTAAPPRCHDKTPKRKQFKFPPAKRLVAIGDVHGDMSQMKRALRAAGLIDDNFSWSGGDTVAVQVRLFQDEDVSVTDTVTQCHRMNRPAARTCSGSRPESGLNHAHAMHRCA